MMLKAFHRDSGTFLLGCIFFLMLLGGALFLNIPYLYLLPVALCFCALFVLDIRIAFITMIATVPFSVQYMDKYDLPDEALMLLITLFFIFFCMFNYRKLGFRKLLLNPVILVVLLSFAWLIVAVLFSQNMLLSSKFLAKKIWYLVPFLFLPIFLFQEKRMMIRSFQYLFTGLLVIVIIVLVRYSALGFAFEMVHDPVQPFFQNHVLYGSMVSSVIPFVVVAFLLSRKLSMQWLITFAALFIFVVAVYFSYSRAAWMAVIFSAFSVILIRFKLMHFAILAFFILVFSGVLWMSYQNRYLNFKPKFEKTIMHESLEDHILATIQGTDISSAERYYRWIAALRLSQDHPVFGVGPNNFYDHYKPYTITSFKTWVSRNPERSTTHNYFLFMLVEQGFIGMLLYAALIFIVFFYGQKVYHRQKEKFYRLSVMASLACIAAVFINNFFSELLETDKIGSIFFLSIAVIIAVDHRDKMMKSKEAALEL